jgi:hypothetical protein
MHRRNRYRPCLSDVLEDRLVLSHAVGRGASVLVSGLNPKLQTLGKGRVQPIIALANQAFDSFQQDYTQTRAAYLATLPGANAGTNAAFQNYTQNRLELLAQQIISSVLTSKSALAKNGSAYVLPAMVARKINGVNTASGATVPYRAGTLGAALWTSIPSSTSYSPQAAALDALSQDQAIQAARVSVINGLNVIRNSDFGVQNKHH